MKFKHTLLLLAGFIAIQPAVREVQSCSVPVFRYALERWRPDPYKGIYIYRDKIAEKDKALLERLKAASRNAEIPLNLIIREVDVDSFPNEKLQELLQGPVPDTLPMLTIWYPDQMGKKPPVWTEKLTPALVEGLLESPKRKKLAESLLRGASVVWVFIPSGNEKKDEAARNLIRQELDSALANYTKTPFSVLSGGSRKQLEYGFPILTVSPDDPSEHIFVEMLRGTESDLYKYTDEPMVFPVFGRGRSLGCLFGEYITAKNVREATTFLAGACSCEVKELNPGVDLLVAAPWDMVVMEAFVEDEPLPELTGVLPSEPAAPAEPETQPGIAAKQAETVAGTFAEASVPDTRTVPVPVDFKEKPTANENGDTGIFAIYGITLGSLLAVVAFTGFILNHRRKKDS